MMGLQSFGNSHLDTFLNRLSPCIFAHLPAHGCPNVHPTPGDFIMLYTVENCLHRVLVRSYPKSHNLKSLTSNEMHTFVDR